MKPMTHLVPIALFSLILSGSARAHVCEGAYTLYRIDTTTNHTSGPAPGGQNPYCPARAEVKLLDLPGKGRALVRSDPDSSEPLRYLHEDLLDATRFWDHFQPEQNIMGSDIQLDQGSIQKISLKGTLTDAGGSASRWAGTLFIRNQWSSVKSSCDASSMTVEVAFTDHWNDIAISCVYKRQ